MMRPLVFLLLLVSCAPRFNASDEEAIRRVMSDQEAAWDRGDIVAFMKGYTDSVCFISKKGMICGREAVTENYEQSYPDKAAMGDLAFGIHEVVPAGAYNAWVTGTWELYRTADTLGGGFSLLWAKGSEGWRIARDHTY